MLQPDLQLVTRRLNAISLDRLARRARLYTTGRDVELRSVPRTLDRSADHHAIGERSALVRAAIIERGPTFVGARDDEPLPRHVNKLHLVRLESIDRYNNRLP